MTLSYQMPLGIVQSYDTLGKKGGEGCSNCQSAVISGGGVWPNWHITFIVDEKS